MKKNIFSKIFKFVRLSLRFIKYLIICILNKYSKPKKISSESPINLIIVSTGGVATTTLMQYLKLYKKTNDENDNDGYKHLNKFPLLNNKKTKIIYIYGGYEKIYNSLKRRNIFQSQMVKLGCPLCYLFRGTIEYFFKLCIDKQIKNFKNKENVFTLNFDNIWEKKEELKKFLDVEHSDFIKNFPVKR